MNSLISLHNAATTLGANTFKKVQFREATLIVCIQRLKTKEREAYRPVKVKAFSNSLMQTEYAKLLFVVFFSIF